MTDQALSADRPAAQDIADIADREWRSFMEPFAGIAKRIIPQLDDPSDPLLRHEMYRFMMQEISRAYMGLFYQDATHPEFWPIQNLAYNVYGPNPDYIYNIASIDDAGVYRISGHRGTVLMVDFQMGGGQLMTEGEGRDGGSLANYEIDSLTIAEDGSFEVIVSQERPEDYDGDWWQIYPGTTYAYVRQGAYDWVNERDAQLAIERLDKAALKPRQDADMIGRTLKRIPGWVENWSQLQLKMLAQDRELGLINNVVVYDFSEEGGTHSQRYVKGQFELEDDEALILETEVPNCQYWSFALHDLNYSTIDYANRHSSLNGFQAKVDSDGKFRGVISARDPGVPNWMDTAGYKRGAILGRWRNADSAPTPAARKVKVAEIRNYLPAETASVTLEDREATIRERSRGISLRRKW